jgi:hypothetical protein
MHITRDASMKMLAGKTRRTDKNCIEIILFPPPMKAFFIAAGCRYEAGLSA